MINTTNFDPMKRQPLKYGVDMVQALERTKELYPEDINFAVSGAIGNERQYSESMEWK